MRRIQSIDILRGLVIMIMALDHTRDLWGPAAFAPEDIPQTTAAYFFTRWITHFCAPVFVFLAGTSAWLYGNKIQDKKVLSFFLLTRGLWLIVAEALLVNPGWTFAMPWQSGQTILQVIWALGCCMIALAALIWLPYYAILTFSLLVIAGHNLLDTVNFNTPLWYILHQPFNDIIVSTKPAYRLFVLYPLLPWIAVMSLGYCMGKLYRLDAAIRRKYLLWTGISAFLLFAVLRTGNIYGDAALWHIQPRGNIYTLLDFLNVTKYPPSLLYLCITLGIACILLALFERWQGNTADMVLVYGKVPFFFYLVHTPLIHSTAALYQYIRYGQAVPFNPERWPAGYGPSLLLVYMAWIGALIVLYFLCRWYGRFKQSHNYWWLKYI